MFGPPKKCMLAMDTVVYIAYHASSHPVSSKEIAATMDIPLRYLEQIMQKLVREGVLRSIRGPRGGYVLAMDRRKITMDHLCNVVGEQNCSEKNEFGSEVGRTVLRPLWEKLSKQMQDIMAEVTLEDLCQQAEENGVSTVRPQGNNDFTI